MKNRYGFLFYDFPENVREDVDSRLVASEEDIEGFLAIVNLALKSGIQMDTWDKRGVITFQKSEFSKVRLALYPGDDGSFHGTLHLQGPKVHTIQVKITLDGMKEV